MSECFAALRVTCSMCRECSAKTVASLYVNCWRKSAFFFGNIGLCVPEPIFEYVGRNIQSRFFRAVCLDLGSRLLASIKDNRGTGKRRASILTHILHNFTAQANQIFTVLSGGIWSVAGRPQRAFYA